METVVETLNEYIEDWGSEEVLSELVDWLGIEQVEEFVEFLEDYYSDEWLDEEGFVSEEDYWEEVEVDE